MTDKRDDLVVELRQYTLRPGQRDALIALFEREFIESQEAVGMTVIGQFRDLDRDDRFVWLRSFPDMGQRARSLTAFYGGPVWTRHRHAANATMLDSSNVLLLRPADPAHGFARGDPSVMEPPPPGTGVVVVGVVGLAAPLDAPSAQHLAADVDPWIAGAGGTAVACLVTEPSPNTFPALPVREAEEVFVWVAAFEDAATARRAGADASALAAVLRAAGAAPHSVEALYLAPTERSALRA